MSDDRLQLDAIVVSERTKGLYSLEPCRASRQWMDDSPDGYANRCLPLRMANQLGWSVVLTKPIRVRWNGNWDPPHGILVEGSPEFSESVSGHFGCGIVTFRLPWLFRTSPGYDLLVRGPANSPRKHISPLEGLVETDWTVSTFTVNWKFTEPHVWKVFAAGDSVCTILPVRRGEIEKFVPRVVEPEDAPETVACYREWRESRQSFLKDLRRGKMEATRAGWQRDYFVGRQQDGERFKEHRTKIQLRQFSVGIKQS